MSKQIPQAKLDSEYEVMLMDACHSLSKIMFFRCRDNPKQGLKYLSNVATYLGCRLNIEIEPKP